MRAEQDIGEAAPISDGYAKRAFRGVNLVRAATTQEELDDTAKQLRHVCDTDTQIKTDVERRSLRAILAQAYAFASKELKRAAAAPTAPAAAAKKAPNATQPASQSLASPLDAVAKGTTASVTDSVFRPEEDAKLAASAGDEPPSAVDSGTANPANGAAATEADVPQTNQAQEEEDALEEPPFIVEEAPVEDPQAAHTPMSSDKFELGDYAVSVMSRVRLGSRTGPSHPSASDARGKPTGQRCFIAISSGQCFTVLLKYDRGWLVAQPQLFPFLRSGSSGPRQSTQVWFYYASASLPQVAALLRYVSRWVKMYAPTSHRQLPRVLLRLGNAKDSSR